MQSGAAIDSAGHRAQGYLALLSVQVFFGLFPIVRRFNHPEFSGKAVVAWRIAVGAIVLVALVFLLYGRRALPARGDWWRLVLCAWLGIVINMVLFIQGLDRSTPMNAGLIVPVIPVFTYAIAALLKQERFEPLRGFGILLAFSGTLWIALQRGPDLSRPYLVGNLMMVTSAFCYAWYLVLARPLVARLPTLVVMAWVFVLSLPTLPLFAADVEWVPAQAGIQAWLALGYILVFATVGAYVLNAFALTRVSSSTTAAWIYLQPLITGAAALVWLEDSFDPGVLPGAALVFIGLWLVIRHHRLNQRARARTSA